MPLSLMPVFGLRTKEADSENPRLSSGDHDEADGDVCSHLVYNARHVIPHSASLCFETINTTFILELANLGACLDWVYPHQHPQGKRLHQVHCDCLLSLNTNIYTGLSLQ